MSTKQAAATLQDARAALEAVRRELTLANAEHTAAGNDLGDALAKVRTGDKKAQGAANKASMKRAELATERDRLQLEESALIAQLQELEAAEKERRAAETLPAFQDVNDEARELERQFAELVQTAAEIGQKLRALRKPWHTAYVAALQAGHAIEDEAPRVPAALVQASVIDDPETRIGRWLGPSQWRQAREMANRPQQPTHFKQVENKGTDTIVYAIEDFPYRGGAA